MEQNHIFNILWEGELSLDRIKWNKKTFQEYKLSQEYENEIQASWEKHINRNPNDYDGNLIFLDDFHFKDGYLFLDTSYMKFSTVTYMVKNKIQVKKGIGILGTQYLVFSPDMNYILIGERSVSQSYFPGATTCPGGILETNDLINSPKKSLMREAYEEINLPVKQEAILSALLDGWNGVSVTFLIKTTLDESYNFSPNETIQAREDEWKNDLRWISNDQLKRLQKYQILDGLTYYQSKLLKTSK